MTQPTTARERKKFIQLAELYLQPDALAPDWKNKVRREVCRRSTRHITRDLAAVITG